MNYQYIDSAAKLNKITKALVQRKTVAVDLEADSMHHYKEKICLIQIATRKTCIVIDPLQIRDLSPLNVLFESPDIQKVFHGADYDVRSLYRDYDIQIQNLFDTELACRFLGVPETGLDAVLYNRFNVQLNKRFQKKDWSKRPLPKEMMDYAASDVIYLIALAAELRKELIAKGRLSWAQEEWDLLSQVRPSTKDEEPLFLRFKGAGRLSPRSLTILESLLQMRDEFALRKDKPWFKILRNQTLLNIAVTQSANLKYLLNNRLLAAKEISMYGSAISRAIDKALAIPENCHLKYPYQPKPRVKPSARRRIEKLRQWREDKAKILRINPAIICNNTLLSIIADVNPETSEELRQIREMKNWQIQTFGDELIHALKSE